MLAASVLATDMSNHFAFVANLQQMASRLKHRVRSEDEIEADRLLICSGLMKCADISNPTRPHGIARAWSTALLEEWAEQARIEAEFKLPISVVTLNPAEKKAQAKSQVGFINLFTQPLFDAMTSCADRAFTLSRDIADRTRRVPRVRRRVSRGSTDMGGDRPPARARLSLDLGAGTTAAQADPDRGAAIHRTAPRATTTAEHGRAPAIPGQRQLPHRARHGQLGHVVVAQSAVAARARPTLAGAVGWPVATPGADGLSRRMCGRDGAVRPVPSAALADGRGGRGRSRSRCRARRGWAGLRLAAAAVLAESGSAQSCGCRDARDRLSRRQPVAPVYVFHSCCSHSHVPIL